MGPKIFLMFLVLGVFPALGILPTNIKIAAIFDDDQVRLCMIDDR